MRTMRTLLAGLMVAVLAATGVARADDVVVERRGSAAGTIARNTLGGALLGSAVAGGIILYQTQVNDNNDYNWERTLVWGALIGAGAGLVFGVVDATSSGYGMRGLHAPVRDGQSLTLDLRRRDQSRPEVFRLYAARF